MSALRKALVRALADMPSPTFDRVNTAFGGRGFRYASLAAFVDAARRALAANGLAVVQPIYPAGGPPAGSGGVGTAPGLDHETGDLVAYGDVLEIRTVVLHESGEELNLGAFAFRPDRSKPQEVGKALTYFRRYALAAALGMVAEDDEDGNGATTKPARKVATLPPEPAGTVATLPPAKDVGRAPAGVGKLGVASAAKLRSTLTDRGLGFESLRRHLEAAGHMLGTDPAEWPATLRDPIRQWLATASAASSDSPEVSTSTP